jgi:hypothetical protein
MRKTREETPTYLRESWGYQSRDSSWTPGVFYTYFYNHARRLRLEKLLYLELSRSSNGFF